MGDNDILAVPSRTAVHRAGSILRKNDASPEDIQRTLSTLSAWRALHSYPINTFQASLRQKVKSAGYGSALIAQRLKRLPSIVTKLKRFPNMGLETMQDIGGIRVILENVAEVYELHTSLLGSRFKHQPLLPPNDYIKTPKSDGYRSLHQVFKYYNKAHPELNCLHIELQVRTQLQHAWATAVETLGIVEKASFKTGEGSADFKRFFKLSSALFSLYEEQPVLEEYAGRSRQDIVRELRELESQLQVTSKLEGLALTAQQIEQAPGGHSGYHLMILDAKKSQISIINFTKKQLDLAERFYSVQEADTKDNPDISVVLIATVSIKDIKKAYPNYFLDTNEFVGHLKRMMNETAE